MRIFLGAFVAALALAAAAYIHNGWTHSAKFCPSFNGCSADSGFNAVPPSPYEIVQERYTWQSAAAIFIAVAGIGAGAQIIVRRPRARV